MARKPSNGDASAAPKKRGRPPKVAAAPTQSNGPSQAQVAAALANLTRLETEGRRINQAKATEFTNFEKIGGDKRALKLLHRNIMLDKREAESFMETLVRYHTGQGINVRFQDDGQGTVIDLLETPAKTLEGNRDLAAAKAHSDGYNSGLHGAVPSDNPFRHEPGSEAYVQWHNGRDEGQNDRLAKNPALSARVTAANIFDDEMPYPGSPEVSPPA